MRGLIALWVGWRHAERRDLGARLLVTKRGNESFDGRPVAAAAYHQEVVVLRRYRNEAEAVELGHRLDADAPVGAVLLDRRGNGVMRLRLVGIARRPRPVEQLVDQ